MVVVVKVVSGLGALAICGIVMWFGIRGWLAERRLPPDERLRREKDARYENLVL